MSVELIGLDAYITLTLKADDTIRSVCGGRIFADQAPEQDPTSSQTQPVPYPIVLFSILSSPDKLGAGAVRIWTAPTVHVSVVGQGGGYGDIAPAADAIDALLKNTGPVVVTWQGQTYNILGMYRTGVLQRPTYENGVRFNWLTGVFKALIQAS
jgi:hypothetical protein